jgi:NADH-quinone oxidoreductase subunit C
MPDATGLELLAGDLKDALGEDAVLGTTYFREQGVIDVRPAVIVDALEALRGRGFRNLMGVHGLDYYPEEPRLGVRYELLDRDALDRVTLRLRVTIAEPNVPSVTPNWPTADFHEREAFDMFGIVFDGHPDLRRILMPEDYQGYPQRRDFPIGGEPVLFTKDHDRDYTRGTEITPQEAR